MRDRIREALPGRNADAIAMEESLVTTQNAEPNGQMTSSGYTELGNGSVPCPVRLFRLFERNKSAYKDVKNYESCLILIKRFYISWMIVFRAVKAREWSAKVVVIN